MIKIIRTEQAGVFRLTTEVLLPRPREMVFDFFADAANLEKITPPWLNFHVVTPLPIEMAAGILIDYRLSLHHIPIRWRTKIAEWQPPFRFTDQQLRGPYRLWMHTHEFEDTSNGTLMRDQVDYSVLGGTIVNRLFVQPDLHKIFSFREERILEHFQGVRQ